MNCPNCKSDNTSVLETRTISNGNKIKRRRKCLVCNTKFTTYEVIEETPLMVIKKDKRTEKFDTNKLTKSIISVFKNRTISEDLIQNTINDIVSMINFDNDGQIHVEIITNFVLEYLRNIDEVAFIRYASYHKNFDSADQYLKIINSYFQ